MKYSEIKRAQIATLHQEREALGAELDTISELATTEKRTTNEAEEVRCGEILARGVAIKDEIATLTADAEALEAIDTERANVPKPPNFVTNGTTAGDDDARTMPATKIIDSIVRTIEGVGIDPANARQLMRKHGKDREWLQNLHGRSTDVYVAAWSKYCRGQMDLLTQEERTAITIGVTTNGGYLVPTFLDPSLILTNAGTDGGIRKFARVVTVTNGNTWYGVTTAGVTASWDGELVEVSDDSPAVGATNIPVFKGAAFVQASVEAFEDINGLASDVLMLLADAKDRLEATAFMTGNGTSAPLGLFTALAAVTASRVVSTTAATIGVVDLLALKRAVPVRFRSNGEWVMNPIYGDAIKTLGAAVSYTYSTDLTQANAGELLGRPVVESDDAPSTQTTTSLDAEIVFGDLSNYVIVDRPGSMSIQFIPVMFNTANNLPDGRVGWYMHFREGGGLPNPAAMRILVDKTSA